MLAFLIPRGEREECLDTFHRALGHAGVSEYLKVYFSLWMTDLDRRTGHSEDLLAHHFLESTDGPRWHHALARWAAGRASDADLALRADTTGKRAEADFYRAMRKLADGRSDEARTLWRKVIDTGMMAFFEFDMASFFLRHPGAVVASSPH